MTKGEERNGDGKSISKERGQKINKDLLQGVPCKGKKEKENHK